MSRRRSTPAAPAAAASSAAAAESMPVVNPFVPFVFGVSSAPASAPAPNDPIFSFQPGSRAASETIEQLKRKLKESQQQNAELEQRCEKLEKKVGQLHEELAEIYAENEAKKHKTRR